MRSTIVLLLFLFAAAPVYAEDPPPDGGADEKVDTKAADIEAADIEKALQADQKAAAKASANSNVAAGGNVGPAASEGGGLGAVARFIQSLNPDLSAIVDFAAGYYSDDDHVIKSGDDPGHTGFNVQEVEVALQAVVDPYFRADVFLTIPNLHGLEVEEAFATTTSLPGNLQVKAGIFRAALGRQNTQHLHVQDFMRRPLLNAVLLGADGLRAPGVEINWLVPRIPFYLLFTASAFSVAAADQDLPLATFGGGRRYDFTYVGSAKTFIPLGDSHSIYLGLNYAHGESSQHASANMLLPSSEFSVTHVAPTLYDGHDTHLYGADAYYKWKPVNQARTTLSLAWQTEYFVRHIPDLAQVEGALYTQLVLQVARRWFLGARGEVSGIPAGDNVRREYAASGSVTLRLTEFAQLRVGGEVRFPRGAVFNGAAFAQLQVAIGAHGAHSF